MKTERVVLLTTPEFKAYLGVVAQREGKSVAELVRSRFERSPDSDEAVLVELTKQLRTAVAAAKKSLQDGLGEAESVLSELRAKKSPQTVATRRTARAAEKLAA